MLKLVSVPGWKHESAILSSWIVRKTQELYLENLIPPRQVFSLPVGQFNLKFLLRLILSRTLMTANKHNQPVIKNLDNVNLKVSREYNHFFPFIYPS